MAHKNDKSGNRAAKSPSFASGSSTPDVLEFDMALTPVNDGSQNAIYLIGSEDVSIPLSSTSWKPTNYAISIAQTATDSNEWTVNDTDKVTLEKGVLYHYLIKKDSETSVSIKITPITEGAAVLEKTYEVTSAEISRLAANVKRQDGAMKIDNIRAYKNAE